MPLERLGECGDTARLVDGKWLDSLAEKRDMTVRQRHMMFALSALGPNRTIDHGLKLDI